MVEKRYLDNGIPVVIEKADGFRSVVTGLWVKTGSRHETPGERGLFHFIEHMFFKGTESRSAEAIAIETDAIGGDLNAYTSRESTTYYMRVLDDYLDKGLDILCDIFTRSVFSPDEIEKEKGIVEEEIRMVEDTPDEYIFDLFNLDVWGDTGLGQPILGSGLTVRRFTRDTIMRHLGAFYTADNIVIACAGNVDAGRCLDLLNRRLGAIAKGGPAEEVVRPEFRATTQVHRKDHAEVHLCMGFEGIPISSPDKYSLLVLNTILGAGVSSRLFQEVREKRGMVYSIHSFISSFRDTGYLGVYAGASPGNYREVMDIIRRQALSLAGTITADELERTKGQLKGNILLSLESTSARMNNIAKQEIYHDRYFSPAEMIREIEKVGLHEVTDIAARLCQEQKLAVTLLGPVTGV